MAEKVVTGSLLEDLRMDALHEQDIALARLDSTALGLNRCASGFSSGSG